MRPPPTLAADLPGDHALGPSSGIIGLRKISLYSRANGSMTCRSLSKRWKMSRSYSAWWTRRKPNDLPKQSKKQT
jgi:hypothetical protein